MNNLAYKILKNIGGKENILELTQCATRLRIEIKDPTKIKEDSLKKLDHILGAVQKKNNIQIVIGPKVVDLYKVINEKIQTASQHKARLNFVQTLSAIFVPVVPAMAGAGMLKAVLLVCQALHLLSAENQTYQILLLVSNTVFYFLPVLLANSASKRFHVNSYVAMIIGAMLINPTFIDMVNAAIKTKKSISLFGLPVTLENYSSSVVPVLLAIWVMSYIEPLIKKIIPKAVQIIFIPMLVLFVMTPLTFILLAPLGSWLGDGLANLINVINKYCSWLIPMIIGAITPLLVMTGMHYALISVAVNSLARVGWETFAGPGMIVSNIAQGGAALAVSLRTKSKKIKSLGVSTGISALLGITEPALYGINLRFVKPLIASMIGGGVGGLYEGLMNVKRYAQVPPSVLALPSFIGKNGDLRSFYNVIFALVISFVVSFAIELFLGINEDKLN